MTEAALCLLILVSVSTGAVWGALFTLLYLRRNAR